MNNYYAESQFCTQGGAIYWLPVQIAAPNFGDAKDIKESVLKSLRDKFEGAESIGPIEVNDAIKSTLHGRYLNARRHGSTGVLNLHLWELTEAATEINLADDLSLYLRSSDPDAPLIYAKVREIDFPIQQLRQPVSNTSEGNAFIVKVITNEPDSPEVEQSGDT